MKYRPEIDGLRALAIVPVVMFHAGFSLFSGGYVGVDIFFVISGYLITTILATELDKKSYSILSFYERRARRILPALFVMLAVTLPCAYILLSTSDLIAYAKSLLGSILFLANITAYMQSGYFDATSDIKPLMHIWSLAIEEQYYLFFPLLLAFLWRFKSYALIAIISLISIVSLILAEVKLNKDASIAFFYLHCRAWELGLGTLLALTLPIFKKQGNSLEISVPLRQLFACFGLALIVYAIAMFDENTRFPGISALVPTIGAALIIAFANNETWVGRLLASKLMVSIGLMSYSAYLWHQPIFAFARYRSPNQLDQSLIVGLILLTASVAYLSWRYIEAPFRKKDFITRGRVAWLSIIGISFFTLIAAIANFKQGFPERYPKEFASAFDPHKIKEGKFCNFSKISDFEDLDFCEFGDLTSKSTVMLFGDSHASSLLGELDLEFKRNKMKGLRVRLLDCNHTIPGMLNGAPTATSVRAAQTCISNFNNFVSFVQSKADAVVVSARWTAKMYPVNNLVIDSSFNNQEGGIEYHKNPSLNYAPTQSGNWVIDGEWKKQAVLTLINKLIETQKQVLVVYPIPEVGWDLPRYNFATYLQTGEVKKDVSTSYALYKSRNQFIIETLNDQRLNKAIRIRPEEFFCHEEGDTRCLAQSKLHPYYYDSNHLASEGAKPIALEIGRKLSGG